jgi:hypothetical protein
MNQIARMALIALLPVAPALAGDLVLDMQDAKVETQPVSREAISRKPDLASPEEDRKSHAAFDIFGDYAFESDFTDSSGSLAVSRVGAQFSVTMPAYKTSQVGLSLEATRWNFDFKNATTLDSVDGNPWRGVNDFNLALTFSNQVTDHWSYVVGGFVRSSYADGAEFSDSITGGALVGATYKFSDNLSIGAGATVHSVLEDEWTILPLITVDWKICEQWALRSTPGVGRRLMGLVYTPVEPLEITLGGGFEYVDFRLDNKSPAPKGVGRFRRFPVGIDVKYSFSRQFSIDAYGGIVLGQQITLDDSNGERIRREDIDSSALIGLSLDWRF